MTDKLTDEQREQAIRCSWQQNADAWVAAVRDGAITSRRLVTDAAVVAAVAACDPGAVLDVGCGEGWLLGALQQQGIAGCGVDAEPTLVQVAQQRGYRASVCSYLELYQQGPPQAVDLMVANFSLLGKASAEQVVAAAARWLPAGGRLVVQTLHPLQACGEQPYVDGWRPGSWDGCGAHFVSPAPWYFRTLESWLVLLQRHGLRLTHLSEPLHPHTLRPASLLLVAECVAPGTAPA